MSEETSEPKGRAPLQKLNSGAVVIKIWRQESANGPFVNMTLGKIYKDKETGKFRESRSLGATDVLKANALMPEAHKEMSLWKEYLKELEQQKNPPAREASTQVSQRDKVLSQENSPQPPEHTAPQVNANSLAEQRDALMKNSSPAPRPPLPSSGRSQTPQQ